MNYLKSIGWITLFSFVAGCFGPPRPNTNSIVPPPTPVQREAGYYEKRRTRTERRSVLDKSKEKYKGKACEDEDRDHDCKEQCRDIYSRRSEREDCEELSISQIERLEDLHDRVKDPDKDDLEDDVDHDDFDVYVNIDIRPLDKYIGRYSTREAKEFLVWMIENPDIAKVFEKEDDDYNAFDRLLKRLKSFSGNDHHLPFIAKVEGSDRLMEVAVESGSEEVVEWFQDYINEKNSDCESDETSVDCFKVYCKIGDEMKNDIAEDWLGYENFEDYINDIIEEGTNKSGTTNEVHYWGASSNLYEDSGDISGNWVDKLCAVGNADLTRN